MRVRFGLRGCGALLGMFVAVWLNGCGGSMPQQIITITADTAAVNAGTTTQLHASARDPLTYTTSDVTSQVSWASSNVPVATVSASGLLSGQTQGSAMITAALKGASGSLQVNIGAPAVNALAITPSSATVYMTSTQQFQATAQYANQTTADVTSSTTWTVTPASVATISPGGLLTPLSSGSFVVIGRYGQQSDAVSGTVTPEALSSIALTPSNPSFSAGHTLQLGAKGTYADGSTADITSQVSWTSSNPGLITVSATGLASASSSSSASGTAVVTATSGPISQSFTVAVNAAATLSEIQIEPSSSRLAVGSAEQRTATAIYSDGTTEDVTSKVTWSVPGGTTRTSASLNGALALRAHAATISSNGTVAVDSTGVTMTNAPGISSVQASMSGVTGQSTVIVTSATPTRLAIRSTRSLFPVGSQEPLQLIGTFSDGTTQDLTLTADWQSSNATIATVDNKGVAAGVTSGPVTFSAGFGGLTVSTNDYRITNNTLGFITVTGAYPAIAKGNSEQLTVTGTFLDGTTKDVTTQVVWGTSDPTVVNISSSGTLFAEQPGIVQVNATVNGVVGTLNVNVVNTTIQSIQVFNPTPTVAAATTMDITALGTFTGGGRQADVTGAAYWLSSDPTILTVNGSGRVKAGNPGTATVTAMLDGVSGVSKQLRVTGATLQRLVLKPLNTRFGPGTQLAAGTAQQYQATGFFSDGTVQDVTHDVVWQVSDPTLAMADQNGTVQAIAPGTIDVWATLGSINVALPLTITSATLQSVSIRPGNTELPVNVAQQFELAGTFSDGSEQDLTDNTVWSSGLASVAIVTNTGAVSGLSAGTGQITAQYGFFSASTSVRVTDATLTSMSITPAAATMRTGQQTQYTVNGTFSDGWQQDLDLNAVVAPVDLSVATTDIHYLVSAVSPGTTSIHATFQNESADAQLTVLSGQISSLTVTPANPTLVSGVQQHFKVTATYADGSTGDVTSELLWSTSNAVVAVDQNGNAMVLPVTQPIQVTITGTIQGQTLTIPTTVEPAGYNQPTSIAITPTHPTITTGAAQQLTATAIYPNGSRGDVTSQTTWSSSNQQVATVDSNGVLTAVAPGVATITGVIGTVTDSVSVSVAPTSGPITPALTRLAVVPTSTLLAPGTTGQLRVLATYADGTVADATSHAGWSTADAQIATVSASGLVQALSHGLVQVTAQIEGQTATAAVNVSNATLAFVAISPNGASFANGTVQQFTLTGTFSDGTTQDLSSEATWTSSAPNVATISPNGAATGINQGQVRFTASFNGQTTATQTVTVTPPTLQQVHLAPSNPSFAKGTTATFKVIGTFSDGTTQDLTNQATLTSSNPATVTVTNGTTVMGRGTGTAQITVTVDGQSVTAGPVTVTPATLTSLSVTPATPSIPNGAKQQFTMVGTFSDGTTQDLSTEALWTSSNPAVLVIDGNGLAESAGLGTATVTASFGGLNFTTGGVTVSSATLTGLTVAPSVAQFAKGTSQQFTATGTYTDASSRDLSTQVTWASSNPAVAVIQTNGLASGVGTGTATLTATVASLSSQATTTITPATLVSIGLNPAQPTVAAGTSTQVHVIGTFSDSTTQDLTSQASFTSSAPAIAAISAAGVVTGVSPGTATITVQYGTTSSSFPVTVNNATLQSLAITPASPNPFPKGTTQQFTLTGTFTDGSTQNLSSQAVWVSSNATVVGVDAHGLATGLGVGAAKVSATFGGNSATTENVTVLPAAVASLSVAPATANLTTGSIQQLTATATYTDSTTQDVSSTANWTSHNQAVATVSSTGMATALTAGTATVTATLNGFTGSATINVTASVPPTATLQSLALTPANASIGVGATQQLTATGTYSDGTTANLTSTAIWTSSNPSMATVNAGLVTGVSAGTATLTAALNGVTASTTVTVTSTTQPPATLQSLAITPSNASVATAATQQLTATATYSNGTTANLTSTATWTSSDPTVATVNAGLVTGATAGTVTITAVDNGVTASATITVTSTTQPPATLQSMAITPANPSLATGATQQLTATGTYSNGTTANLTSTATWTSSNPAVATVNAGLVTGATAGTVTITAVDNGVAATTNVTVTSTAQPPTATLQSLAITPTNGSVTIGATQQLTATGTYSNGTTANLTSTATWTSSSPAIATVNAGLVTGASAGSATIIAAVPGATASDTITVTTPAPATVQTIAIAPADADVAMGGTLQYRAMATYTDGSTGDVTSSAAWTSSVASVATISPSGLAASAGAGRTQIRASVGGQMAVTTLTVEPATLTHLSVTPATATFANGTTQQYRATAQLSDGSTQDVTTSVTWESSSTSVATIDTNGLARGVGQGTATVMAAAGSTSGTATATVTAAYPTAVTLTPAAVTLASGNVQQLTATATFTDGSSQDVSAAASYSSSNKAVVTVDAHGKLTAVGAGTATVTATLNGINGTAAITVTPAALQVLTITPANLHLAAGLSQQMTATGTFSDGSTQNLTNSLVWSSSDSTVATVSATGVVMMAAPGAVTITAQQSAGAVSAQVTVVGTNSTAVTVAVSPASATLAVGQTQQFAATATMTDGTQQDVTATAHWSTSDATRALVGDTALNKGLATALLSGTITVQATVNGASGAANLTVNAAVLQSVTVAPNPASLPAGTALQLRATGTYTDGSTADVTSSAVWTTGSASVATVNGRGLLHGIAQGSTMATATVGLINGTASVTVSAATLQSISITPNAPSFAAGLSQQLTATGQYSDGSTQNLTNQVHWSSSAAAVATVSGTGLVRGLTSGSTTVAATLNGVNGTDAVTVTAATLSSITVSASQSGFALGQSLQLRATGNYTDGSTADLTQLVAWTSSVPSVGLVSATGWATGKSTGSFMAQASLNGINGQMALTVTAAVLQSIAVTPANTAVVNLLGNSVQYTATGTFSDGSTQNLTSTAHWSIAAGVSVGTISSTGRFTPLGLGIGTVAATLGTVSGSTGFTVVSVH